MNFPQEFIQNIESVFEEDGKQFIRNLPNLIKDASTRWQLGDVQPVSNLSFNFVAYATSPLTPPPLRGTRPKGEGNVVLKIGVPRDELTSEMVALKFYDGNGACKLIDSDEDKGFLLLERLKPGKMLSELEDDDERTHIAMDIMLNIQSRGAIYRIPTNDKFIKLSDWFDGLKKIQPHFNGGTGIFPKEILERVVSGLPDLFKDKNILLHGDFHHFNILLSERGWLIIDPKGVIGPAGYEIGPLMLNPMTNLIDRTSFKVQTQKRIDIIKERTGWEREKIIQWALSHAILSAWWDVEDDMQTNFSLECAKIFFELK